MNYAHLIKGRDVGRVAVLGNTSHVLILSHGPSSIVNLERHREGRSLISGRSEEKEYMLLAAPYTILPQSVTALSINIPPKRRCRQTSYIEGLSTMHFLPCFRARNLQYCTTPAPSIIPSNATQVICSVNQLSPEHGGGICATYRCDGGTTKLTIKARTTEGDYGDVRLTIVANTPPKKSAQVFVCVH